MLLGVLESSRRSDETSTYQLIQTIVLDSAQEISITNIPQTYKHLQIRLTYQSSVNNTVTLLRLNSDASTIYGTHGWYNRFNDLGTFRLGDRNLGTTGFATNGNRDSEDMSAQIVTIFDYTGNDSKHFQAHSLGESDDEDDGRVSIFSNVYSSTDPITELQFFISGGSVFDVGSRVSIYGIEG